MLTGFIPVRSFRWSRLDKSDAAVVLMCLWNRPTRITEILQRLDAQDHAGGVRLFLWNNCRADHHLYIDALKSFTPERSLCEVSLVKSPYNLGSISRFYWGRKLVMRENIPTIVVLDDDQDFNERFISQAMSSRRPNTFAAWWAWTIDHSYWDRTAAKPGDRIDHIGPGGMVADAAFLRDREFFTGIPDRWGRLDDIWLSHYALSHGIALQKLQVDLDFVMEDTNQFHGQIDVKSEFWGYLNADRS